MEKIIENETVENLCKRAKIASREIAHCPTNEKNRILELLADRLLENKEDILAANARDIALGKDNGLSDAMIDRLSLQGGRLEGVVTDLLSVVALDDPIGVVIDEKTLNNGLNISKVRSPLGVIGVIYESRPNVTIDIAALAIKTGNATVIRGGKETINSNKALVDIVKQTLAECNISADCFMFIDDPRRECVHDLLQCYDSVDMIIPRGGASLHQYCRENSKIPVITGGIGICHLFIDETAKLEKALDVVFNAKTQRPSVCNALDTILVHDSIARKFIPQVIDLLGESGVTFKVASNATEYVKYDHVELANDETDWDTEWLSLVLGIKIVSSIDEAIDHITKHSSGHSDGILTESEKNSQKFIQYVDSAAVYVNASTRFTDGSQLGLGAEIAVSTQKLHVRGPMALEELTTYKWLIRGNYQCR